MVNAPPRQQQQQQQAVAAAGTERDVHVGVPRIPPEAHSAASQASHRHRAGAANTTQGHPGTSALAEGSSWSASASMSESEATHPGHASPQPDPMPVIPDWFKPGPVGDNPHATRLTPAQEALLEKAVQRQRHKSSVAYHMRGLFGVGGVEAAGSSSSSDSDEEVMQALWEVLQQPQHPSSARPAASSPKPGTRQGKAKRMQPSHSALHVSTSRTAGHTVVASPIRAHAPAARSPSSPVIAPASTALGDGGKSRGHKPARSRSGNRNRNRNGNGGGRGRSRGGGDVGARVGLNTTRRHRSGSGRGSGRGRGRGNGRGGGSSGRSNGTRRHQTRVSGRDQPRGAAEESAQLSHGYSARLRSEIQRLRKDVACGAKRLGPLLTSAAHPDSKKHRLSAQRRRKLMKPSSTRALGSNNNNAVGGQRSHSAARVGQGSRQRVAAKRATRSRPSTAHPASRDARNRSASTRAPAMSSRRRATVSTPL